jgi:putative transposon-encoded protein
MKSIAICSAVRVVVLSLLLITLGMPAHALTVTRGPYLQVGTSTAITVRWRTDAASDSRVVLGSAPGSLTLVSGNGSVVTEHVVTVTGLTPDTRYYYAVGSTTATLAGDDAQHFFFTAPAAGTPKATRVWAIGDAGTKNANQRAVRDAYYAFTGSRATDVFLMLGDNAYNTGTDAEYQDAVFGSQNGYAALLRRTCVWPTIGNHDTAQAMNWSSIPYYNMFSLPTAGQAGGMASGTPDYYSFDYGNIHFICLDSMRAGDRARTSAQAVWLRADLAATAAKWIIAFWHHPPYSKGSHDSDTETELREMRENFLPILEAGGVDLVLSGHSHSYERSFLLNGHYGLSGTLTSAMKKDAGNGRLDGTGAYSKSPGANRGAVYIVAGSSGQASGGRLNHPAMMVSLNRLGSLVVDVDGERLTARFLRENGVVDDTFTLVKEVSGIAVFRPATREWMLRSDSAPVAVPFGESGDVRVPADYLGLKRAQIATFRPATGEWSVRDIAGATVPIVFGTADDTPVPADYAGLGKVQFALFRPTTAEWRLRREDGGTDLIPFGAPGDVPVPAHYLGLKRTQIAVFSPTTLQWLVRQEDGNSTPVQFGEAGDQPLPGDYLGLGYAQMAVFRPSTGAWLIRDRAGVITTFLLGAAGDRTVPLDYLGLGYTQSAVFRPSTREWIIREREGPTMMLQFGEPDDEPVPARFPSRFGLAP